MGITYLSDRKVRLLSSNFWILQLKKSSSKFVTSLLTESELAVYLEDSG